MTNTALSIKNRIHLLNVKDPVRNANIIRKLNRQLRQLRKLEKAENK